MLPEHGSLLQVVHVLPAVLLQDLFAQGFRARPILLGFGFSELGEERLKRVVGSLADGIGGAVGWVHPMGLLSRAYF